MGQDTIIEKKSTKNNTWEIMRGIACILVAFHHYTARYDEVIGHKEDWLIKSDYGGQIGVCVFFILTGLFLIPSLKSANNYQSYLHKRFLRLVPTLFFCVIITTIILYFSKGLFCGIATMICNIFMIQDIVGVAHIDGAYWTLTTQLLIYIVMGGAFYLFNKRDNLFLAFVISWLILGGVMHLIYRYTTFSSLSYLSCYKFIHLFIQGIIIHYLAEKKINDILLYGVAIISVLYSLTISIPYFSFNVILFLLILYIHLKNINILKFNFFAKIGTVSYAFYALHQKIGFEIIELLEGHEITAEWLLIVPFVSIFGLAYMITYYFERPIINKLKIRK